MLALSIEELRHEVALSCRILAFNGLMTETLGHVSARIPATAEMLIRGRPVDESGLLFTRDTDILRMDFDGKSIQSGETVPPGEFPIHGEIYKARPDVQCVVHAHPWGALFCGLADIKLRPIFGAFDPSALRSALEPLPVFNRSISLLSAEAAVPMVQLMGTASACLMRGHGITVVGATVQDATIRAVKLETLARIMWLTSQRGRIPDISAEDQAYFLEASDSNRSPAALLATMRGREGIWRYYIAQIHSQLSETDAVWSRREFSTTFGSVANPDTKQHP
jgi:ribulose-5-phosphate 4-epimerase/fuculose-1-phosphate aldolase